ncbi:MAG: hypothetical protein JSR78_08450 [Proteobacteria bacterium]|nr:hypothetical protein [Pseudomonadota bacterium]
MSGVMKYRRPLTPSDVRPAERNELVELVKIQIWVGKFLEGLSPNAADDLVTIETWRVEFSNIVGSFKRVAISQGRDGKDAWKALAGAARISKATDYIQDLRNRTIPTYRSLSRFLKELEAAYVELEARITALRSTSHDQQLQLRERKDPKLLTDSAFVRKILSAWNADSSLVPLEKLPAKVVAKAAALAVKVLLDNEGGITEEVIDDVTGLVLPPKLVKPYRERGHHQNGKRLNVFEHLALEYPDYLKNRLLFSGHIQAIDRPAYEALVYLANKDAKALGKRGSSHLAAFLWQHGILAAEHLMNPPPGVERQAKVIKDFQDKRKNEGMNRAVLARIEKAGAGER